MASAVRRQIIGYGAPTIKNRRRHRLRMALLARHPQIANPPRVRDAIKGQTLGLIGNLLAVPGQNLGALQKGKAFPPRTRKRTEKPGFSALGLI